MATTTTSFRFSESVLQHLDYLVDITGTGSRTAFLTSVIETEYDRCIGNPELIKLLDQMRAIQAQVKIVTGQPSGDPPQLPE